MAPDPAFEDLMERLRGGDGEAAQEIFRRFAQRLIALARGRLDAAMRQKVDPEEVMQSVFKSFFRRQADEPFDLASWDGLWSLLVVIALRKCGNWRRRFQADCRDVQREAPQPTTDEDPSACWQAIARDPTPSEAAVLTEMVEQLMRGLDHRDRRIVELSLQGYTAPEISARVGRAERTIYRLLERIRQRLQRMTAEDAVNREG